MPGFPAFLLLAACVVLLVPGWGARVRGAVVPQTGLRRSPALLLAIVLTGLAPLVAVAALPPASAARIARNNATANEIPLSADLSVKATRATDGVRFHWTAPAAGGARVFYLAFRQPASRGSGCTEAVGGAAGCDFSMPFIGRTAITALTDSPLPGRYTYRIGMAAAPVAGNADLGDMVLLSPPITFDVRCTTDKCRRDVRKLRAMTKP
jgi:hypothetical protein